MLQIDPKEIARVIERVDRENPQLARWPFSDKPLESSDLSLDSAIPQNQQPPEHL